MSKDGPLEFDEIGQTVEYFLEQNTLPILTKITSNSETNLGPEVELDQPFLLYANRRRTKVLVRFSDPNIQEATPVEIPKDYPGWFLVDSVGEDTQTHYKTVKEVVEETVESRFLVRSKLVGARKEDSNKNNPTKASYEAFPGEIIKFVERKPDDNNTTEVLLEDSKGVQFLATAETEGTFNAIAHKKPLPKYPVFQLTGVLSNFNLPLNVELIMGWLPPLSKNEFNGKLVMCEVFRPDTVIAYCQSNKRHFLCELPIDIDFTLHAAKKTNEPHLAHKSALAACESRVFNYVTCMKPMQLPYTSTMLDSRVSALKRRFPAPLDMTYYTPSLHPTLAESSRAWAASSSDVTEGIFLDKPGVSKARISMIGLKEVRENQHSDPGKEQLLARMRSKTNPTEVKNKGFFAKIKEKATVKEREAKC